jgi:hypothetical protein
LKLSSSQVGFANAIRLSDARPDHWPSLGGAATESKETLMFKILFNRWSLVAAAAVLMMATAASAVPTTYLFTSGSVQLSAINTTTGNSVLEGPSVVTVPLGGTFVVFDPDLGANGTILDLQFIPTGSFSLDLNPIEAELDSILVENAMLINAPGIPDATAAVDGAGGFFLDSEMSGDVSGVFADTTPFPSTPFSSITSGASGNLILSGDTLQLALLGINIATFGTATNPGSGEVEVKADFFFVSTVVPEPGTALLMGLGLAALAGSRSQRRA